MEKLRPREVICPRMHSKEGTEPGLECGSPKLEIQVSISLLDVTSRDPPSPPSFWPGPCPCSLPELDLALPNQSQGSHGPPAWGSLSRCSGIVMEDPIPLGWVLSQLQLQWPSQAHRPWPLLPSTTQAWISGCHIEARGLAVLKNI